MAQVKTARKSVDVCVVLETIGHALDFACNCINAKTSREMMLGAITKAQYCIDFAYALKLLCEDEYNCYMQTTVALCEATHDDYTVPSTAHKPVCSVCNKSMQYVTARIVDTQYVCPACYRKFQHAIVNDRSK